MIIPIFIPLFINQEPKEEPLVYKKHILGNDNKTTDIGLKKLEEEADRILIENNIDYKKVRYTHAPLFLYDIDNDVVNPKREYMLPTRGDFFDNTKDEIVISKPKNMIQQSVFSYKVDDNLQIIKNTISTSKLGIVVFLHEPSEFEADDYKFGILSNELRFFNLDDI